MSVRRLLGAHLQAASPERRETVAGQCLGCLTHGLFAGGGEILR